MVHPQCEMYSVPYQDDHETQLRAFFCRYYCPFSFYSMPLFLRERAKRERESNGDINAQSFDSSPIKFSIFHCLTFLY